MFTMIPAPPYCGPHTVSSQGWNYPGQREAVEGEQYSVDLGAHPPYHQPPEGFKVGTLLLVCLLKGHYKKFLANVLAG